jgi:hypothetical protein
MTKSQVQPLTFADLPVDKVRYYRTLLPEPYTLALHIRNRTLSILTVQDEQPVCLHETKLTQNEAVFTRCLLNAAEKEDMTQRIVTREELQELYGSLDLTENGRQPVRNLISRVRSKLIRVGLVPIAVLETGYMVALYKPFWRPAPA